MAGEKRRKWPARAPYWHTENGGKPHRAWGKARNEKANLEIGSPKMWWWIVDYLRTCYFDYLVIKSK